MTKIIAWFSCGAASAVAAKITAEQLSSEYDTTEIVYCDTMSTEHPDNQRFFDECQDWFGQEIIRLHSRRFRDIDGVFMKQRFMAGPKGARCTTEMKKIPRMEYCAPDDVHVFGFTSDEADRRDRFEKNNPDLFLRWALIEFGITKNECYRRLSDAGIRLPEMYLMGYRNNNCIGCVKSGSPGYWAKIREDFPEVFKRRAEQARAIGCKLVEYPHHTRMWLDELPEVHPKTGKPWVYKGENISCGPECGQQLELI